jgi:hypothetical protein
MVGEVGEVGGVDVDAGEVAAVVVLPPPEHPASSTAGIATVKTINFRVVIAIVVSSSRMWPQQYRVRLRRRPSIVSFNSGTAQ